MFSTEEASKSSRERWALVVSGVRMQNQCSLGSWQRRGLLVSQGAIHRCRGDLVNLISVNEPQAVVCLDGDTIKKILFGHL